MRAKADSWADLPRRLVLATAAAGAVTTVLVSVLPFIDFARRSSEGHVAIETAATIIGLLAALLVGGRFRRTGELPDLLLAAALLLLALTNLFFSTLPSLGAGEPETFELWSPVLGRLLGAGALVAAAFAPARPLRTPSRAMGVAAAAVGLALAAVALCVVALEPVLPGGIDPRLSPESSGRPRIVGDPGFLIIQLMSVPLYAAAAYGFLKRAQSTHDELMLWLAPAAVVGAFARINYFLFPSLQSEWVYVGDIMRLAFWLLLLAAASREILSYQTRLAEAAVGEERRRMARDLHDGLAQDLAFIATHSRRLGARFGAAELSGEIAYAADRALDNSRDAISALTRPLEEPVAVSVARAAEEVGGRAGLDVHTDLSWELIVPLKVREAMVRIVREAVTNATRHGQARSVTVTLVENGDIRLAVRDDGKGFSTHDRDGYGFGLTSMGERVEALGGTFQVSSSDAGTLVEVVLP